MTDELHIPEPFGPKYDVNSVALGKFRQAAKDGLHTLDRAQVIAYAKAVEAAVLSSQRSSLRREKPEHAPNCASGTWHAEGEDIHKAVRSKQKAALFACPGQIRRARTPRDWHVMYAQAMAEKAKLTPVCDKEAA